ncbi:MAG: metallophosphoesterase [Candidatus Kapaibacterium sp.]
MLTRRQFITTLALASFGGCRALTGLTSSGLEPQSCCWDSEVKPTTIAIVGDVQRTGLLEMTTLGRSQNDREREAVLNAIAADQPDMLLMLGDQVVLGDDEENWIYFDRIMAPIRDIGIPVRAMLGNHDYEGENSSVCIGSFCQRFPYQRDGIHGLTLLGPIALITLDSNFDRLTREEKDNQTEQYKKWLAKLDKDPDVKGVIVASHHPPYTNSDLSDHKEVTDVLNAFAGPFKEAVKTRLYLSGHVHNYERFIAGDKMFVVSGGGGGPRREVDISPNRPYHNDAYRRDRSRPFHYLRLTIHEEKMMVETRMLRKGSKWDFATGDRFALGLVG